MGVLKDWIGNFDKEGCSFIRFGILCFKFYVPSSTWVFFSKLINCLKAIRGVWQVILLHYTSTDTYRFTR